MKNVDEWSLGFDQLYNNITSNQAPGLNEYEKSVFLTDAQESVVIGLYNGSLGRSFEETEELTSYLDTLVTQFDCDEVSSDIHIVSGSHVFALPEDLLFRTYEKCTLDTGTCGDMDAIVVPVTQDEFWRTNRNPFKGPNKTKVLRLTFAESGSEKYSELVSRFPIKAYSLRYLKRPEPIILTDLADGLTVRGESNAKTCQLPEQIHQTILEQAVAKAKAVWASR